MTSISDNMAEANNTATSLAASSEKTRSRRRQQCRFFGTKKGCRAGDACPFVHDLDLAVPSGGTRSESPQQQQPPHQNRPQRRYNPPAVDASKTVQRPVPQLQKEDPRAFQIGQVRRRFKPTETEDGSASLFLFKMSPSDPDFPYEIDALECQMTVPFEYPLQGRPSLKVTNPDIPRGFQINIENGFDTIAATSPEATLLGIMNRLDKQLEVILSGKMAETIKIVTHRHRDQADQVVVQPSNQTDTLLSEPAQNLPPNTFSEEDLKQAEVRRQNDTRQLEARFGRLPSFSKSSDGFMYQMPLDSPKRNTWPADLQLLRMFTLLVPAKYPLDPPTIHLDSDSEHARSIESSFKARATNIRSENLTQRINYLTVHLSDMAKELHPAPQEQTTENESDMLARESSSATASAPRVIDEDKQHVQVIPRPPEWDMIQPEDYNSGSEDDYSYDTGDDTEGDEHVQQSGQQGPSAPAEKGVLLSLPNLEFHGIELLELVSLSVTVKCERCREITDIDRLRNNTKGDESGLRAESCRKCANHLYVGFRADMMHSSSVRAGYLDLDGCTVVDMLPSAFVPTCSECSSPHPAPGVMSVRGESTMAICRECHRRMTFRISEVKFLQISAAAIRSTRAPQRKKIRENLGITAGSNLPRRGRCQHYAKSYRWFRFSCCSKVFACDRCHDEKTDHPNEHANRMLCGFCSREQNYRPEDCGVCKAVLVGKAGHGFWEGGKGTRDRARMSRKDPRKYKRRPGATSSKT